MRRLLVICALVTVVATVSASASLLDVDGAVVDVFEPDIPMPVPGGAEATIQITPQSLNAGSNGEALQAQITLNDGCTQEDIVFSSISLRVAGENASVSPNREISRTKNKLIVRFDRQEVINLIGGYLGDSVMLEVSGHDAWGCEFTGFDTIKLKPASDSGPSTSSDDLSTTEPDGAGESGQPSTETDGSTEPSTDGGASSESGSDTSGDSGPESSDSP